MKLLLDTQILLWSQLEPKRLSRRVAGALDNWSNERWISPARWFEATLKRVPSREATFTHEAAAALDSFVLPHSDPIDAILVATAKVYGLTLVTADRVLIEAKACPVLSNL